MMRRAAAQLLRRAVLVPLPRRLAGQSAREPGGGGAPACRETARGATSTGSRANSPGTRGPRWCSALSTASLPPPPSRCRIPRSPTAARGSGPRDARPARRNPVPGQLRRGNSSFPAALEGDKAHVQPGKEHQASSGSSHREGTDPQRWMSGIQMDCSVVRGFGGLASSARPEPGPAGRLLGWSRSRTSRQGIAVVLLAGGAGMALTAALSASRSSRWSWPGPRLPGSGRHGIAGLVWPHWPASPAQRWRGRPRVTSTPPGAASSQSGRRCWTS